MDAGQKLNRIQKYVFCIIVIVKHVLLIIAVFYWFNSGAEYAAVGTCSSSISLS